jgi:hypothetical protein
MLLQGIKSVSEMAISDKTGAQRVFSGWGFKNPAFHCQIQKVPIFTEIMRT